MPCICYGEISGKEEFDRFVKEHPERYELIKSSLQKTANLIKGTKISMECYDQEWHLVWMECFAHMLNGCPEKAQNGI